jgi:hypothetical protein
VAGISQDSKRPSLVIVFEDFYSEDTTTGHQISLRAKDEAEALLKCVARIAQQRKRVASP